MDEAPARFGQDPALGRHLAQIFSTDTGGNRGMSANMAVMRIVAGITTMVPGIYALCHRGVGGTASARYCYSIWLRHLVQARRYQPWRFPRSVAELGPGDSLGIGLAALICGADRYLGFDVIKYASEARNLAVFDELVALFKARADIPDAEEFPRVKPYLGSYDFPSHILTEEWLDAALDPDRLARIRAAASDMGRPGSPVRYVVPWHDASQIERASVDMIFSQAVLEHVDDLDRTYAAMRDWLRPGGIMSHQIDFRCHGTADDWNGHWTCSDLHWRLIRGGRPYLINRQPRSTHLDLLKRHGFELVYEQIRELPSVLDRSDLAPRFRLLSDTDLTTSGAHMLSRFGPAA